MPKYTYKVRDEQGRTFTGSYTTDNKDRLRAALQNKGVLLEEDEPLGYCVTSADSSIRHVGTVVLKISFLGQNGLFVSS